LKEVLNHYPVASRQLHSTHYRSFRSAAGINSLITTQGRMKGEFKPDSSKTIFGLFIHDFYAETAVMAHIYGNTGVSS
jgi:hypothetical protein